MSTLGVFVLIGGTPPPPPTPPVPTTAGNAGKGDDSQ